MKRTGDIYPYDVKTLLLNVEDGKYSGERDFCKETLPPWAGGTVCAAEHLCGCIWWAVEREQESSLLHGLAAKGFNCDRRDSD